MVMWGDAGEDTVEAGGVKRLWQEAEYLYAGIHIVRGDVRTYRLYKSNPPHNETLSVSRRWMG